jgi:hypothetical protein
MYEHDDEEGDRRWRMATVGMWFMRGMGWFPESTPGWRAGGYGTVTAILMLGQGRSVPVHYF